MRFFHFFFILLISVSSLAAIPIEKPMSLKERLQARIKPTTSNQNASLIFDIPVTYNRRVSYWIQYYQSSAKDWFAEWLEKSTRYMPTIQRELKGMGLPQDLA